VVWIQEKVDAIQAWWSGNGFDPNGDCWGSPEAGEMWNSGNGQHELLRSLADRLGVVDKIRWIAVCDTEET